MKETFNKIIRKIRLVFNAWYVHTLLVIYDAIYGEYERRTGKAYE